MTGNLKLLCNFVEKFLGTVRFSNDQFALILGYGDLIVQLILFIVDSGCIKHTMGYLKLLCNFVEKFLCTVHFGNDQFAPILGYGDLVQGNVTINRVYYVEGLNYNLFSVGQFCDAELEKDIVTGLPKLKYVNDQLCSSCELSKAKRSSFKSKAIPSSKGSLNLLHMDLCGLIRVASINGKKYILDVKEAELHSMSSAEAEYVALSASCAQSAIAIFCNPVQHSCTKHIHTRYHFIKEQVENGIIELYVVRTEYQLADMFTKALPEDRFKYLVRRIGMRCLTLAELEVLAKESA
nr:retrovirus-related Pol polyprotein from transposon TNT 1-94 [Tanacetum cinerariifolium]